MPSETYSFIDVAVLDAVRERFAAGDAMAILSADLEQVIWANGPGAALFGYDDIEAIIGASAGLRPARQAPDHGDKRFSRDRPRPRRSRCGMTTGLTSRAVGFMASAVTMPDGENAIMLAVPATQTGSRSAGRIAERAISGFNEAGHFVAFVDGSGEIEAASAGFADTRHLAARRWPRLSPMFGGESGAHRQTPRSAAASASCPAGLARLTDERRDTCWW